MLDNYPLFSGTRLVLARTLLVTMMPGFVLDIKSAHLFKTLLSIHWRSYVYPFLFLTILLEYSLFPLFPHGMEHLVYLLYAALRLKMIQDRWYFAFGMGRHKRSNRQSRSSVPFLSSDSQVRGEAYEYCGSGGHITLLYWVHFIRSWFVFHHKNYKVMIA